MHVVQVGLGDGPTPDSISPAANSLAILSRTPERRAKVVGLSKDRKQFLQSSGGKKKNTHCIVENDGSTLPGDQHNDIVTIMSSSSAEIESLYLEGTFRRLFWEELKAACSKGTRGMRSHPQMIRWALHLRMRSSSAYHAMKTAGFITLPSNTTLRDCHEILTSPKRVTPRVIFP